MHPHIPRPRRKATRTCTDTAGVVRTVHGEFMWPFTGRGNEKPQRSNGTLPLQFAAAYRRVVRHRKIGRSMSALWVKSRHSRRKNVRHGPSRPSQPSASEAFRFLPVGLLDKSYTSACK